MYQLPNKVEFYI